MSKNKRWAVVVALVALTLAASTLRSAAKTQGPAVTAQKAQERMTNSDVLRMVQERRSESDIIRGIRAAVKSGGAEFDLSPNTLLSLHKAGVSNNVLNAMMSDAGKKSGVSSPKHQAWSAADSLARQKPQDPASGQSQFQRHYRSPRKAKKRCATGSIAN